MEHIQDLIISSVKEFLVQHSFIPPVKLRMSEDEGEEGEEEEEEPRRTLQGAVDPPSQGARHQVNHMEPDIFASLQPQVSVRQRW